jgi:hypothetical protein
MSHTVQRQHRKGRLGSLLAVICECIQVRASLRHERHIAPTLLDLTQVQRLCEYVLLVLKFC